MGIAAMTAVLACGAPPAPATDGADPPLEPTPGGSLVVAAPADISVLNPLVARSTHEMEVLAHLFPYLVEYDFEGACKPRPGLAESWTVGEDGMSLTFRLKTGGRWTDGEAIDADDVVFTLDLVGDPAVGSPYGSLLMGLRAEDAVERVDAHTVTVHFAEARDPATMLNQVTAYPLVPEHALRDVPRAELRAASTGEGLVSAGPFSLGAWLQGQQLELVRNESPPYGAPARLDRVVFKVLPEYTTRLLELQQGGVDMMPGLAVEDVTRLKRDAPGVEVHRRQMRSTDYIAWNLNDPRFADAKVRRALAHAVDVDALMGALLKAGDEVYGQRGVGTITPALADYRNPDLQPIAHDVEQARALFGEAGWTDSDGDGFLDRDGERFEFTLLTGSSNPRRTLAQTIVQEQLRNAGVDVSIDAIEGNAFHGKLAQRDFEAALVGWSAQLFVDPSPLWHSADAPFNVSSYANPKVDELIARGLATTDPDEAASCWRELQALIHADQPCCFLYWRDELVGLNGQIEGATIDTLSPYARLGEWWRAGPRS
jgi:peptide/nickel transport system substrate-binding protein